MIEFINPDAPRGPFQAAIFDFDGTLSLFRRNWQDVMIPMMVEILAQYSSDETPEQLTEVVEEFVMRLNGKQTIYQMMRLDEEVQQRGGPATDPLQYKHRYHDRLWQEVGRRVTGVEEGELDAEQMLVPGALAILEGLRQQGVPLYLASGTDLVYVRREAEALGLTPYFGERIYGALDDYRQFSKAMILQKILEELGPDTRIVGFGDGFVEIEEVKRVGGLAVGVASDENLRNGINAWKRNRLIQAGADWIIADFANTDMLLQHLFAWVP